MQRLLAISEIVACALAAAAVASALCSDPTAPDVTYHRGDPIPAGAWVFEIPGYAGQLGGPVFNHNGDPYFGTAWLSNPGSGPNGADYCVVGLVSRTTLAGFCDTIGADGITLGGAPPPGCAWKWLSSVSATDPVVWTFYEPFCAGTGVTGAGFASDSDCLIARTMASNSANKWTAPLSLSGIGFKLYKADHCIAGYENFDPVALTCTKCRPGNYRATADVNPLNCVPCAAGTFTASEGATVCNSCAAGNFSSPGASACTACAAGTFASAEGSASCKPCPAGTYSSNMGATACTPCSDDTVPNAGATACVACPSGFTGKEGKCMLAAGPIVGIAVGGAVFLIIVLAVIIKCFCCKKAPATPYVAKTREIEVQNA